MKKISCLLSIFCLCVSLPVLASTPYDDVPLDHWAYDAVTELTNAGIVEGYGDGTFRGEQPITRFEMAKMIRNAVISEEAVSDKHKKLLDKLAKEYEEELKGFNVRIVELERKVGNVRWGGQLRYRYISDRYRTTNNGGFAGMFGGGNNDIVKRRSNYQYLTAILEPDIKINDHWTGHMRLNWNIDAKTGKNASDGTFGNNNDGGGIMAMFGGGNDGQSRSFKEFYVDRLWLQGDYKNLQINLGRLPYKSIIDRGMVFDDNVTGGQVTVGSKLKGTITAGRVNSKPNGSDDNGGIFAMFGTGDEKTWTDYIGAELYQTFGKATAGVGYHWFKNRAENNGGGMMAMFGGGGNNAEQSASIFSAGASYQFDKVWGINLAGAWNTKEDMGYNGSKRSLNAEVTIGKKDLEKTGSLSGYVAYRHLGNSVTWRPNYEVMNSGQKGWEFGIDYVFAKNMDVSLRYFTGKNLKDGLKTNTFFTELNCYF